MSRYNFYEHLKSIIAAPPEVLRVDEKNLREYPVPNVTGVVLTTNYKTAGIYLPPDDRRHYVAWSECDRDEFDDDYWKNLYAWYDAGGRAHVAAYLRTVNLATFDPKAPPPETAAWYAIVDANLAPEENELADAIDKTGRPTVLTLEYIGGYVENELAMWLVERKNRRIIPQRMEACGYVAVRNPHAKSDGRWVIRSGPRNLDSGLSEISIVFQAAVPKPVVPKYTISGVRRPSEL